MGKSIGKPWRIIGLVVEFESQLVLRGLQVNSTIEKDPDALKVELAQRKDELKKLRSEDVITAETVAETQASTN